MKLLKWLFYIIILVAVIIVGGSFFLPSEAIVTRSAEIKAPPEKVFAIVGDYRRFSEFSPWADLDPATVYTFEGAESGIGQKMLWSSKSSNVGSGSQTITDYQPPNRVMSEVDFGDMGKSTAEWQLAPSADGTTATWTFRAPLQGIASRWFGLMFDKWIGADYEKGLAKLKAAAEKA